MGSVATVAIERNFWILFSTLVRRMAETLKWVWEVRNHFEGDSTHKLVVRVCTAQSVMFMIWGFPDGEDSCRRFWVVTPLSVTGEDLGSRVLRNFVSNRNTTRRHYPEDLPSNQSGYWTLRGKFAGANWTFINWRRPLHCIYICIYMHVCVYKWTLNYDPGGARVAQLVLWLGYGLDEWGSFLGRCNDDFFFSWPPTRSYKAAATWVLLFTAI